MREQLSAMVLVVLLAATAWADDILVGAGPGGAPHVKVFDGMTQATLQSFFAYDPAFNGGVRVAAGDLSGDGIGDIITGSGTGSHVRVFDGTDLNPLASFFAFAPTFTGGVYVGTGDKNFVPGPEIVVAPGVGGPPTNGQVNVFDPAGNFVGANFSMGFGFPNEIRIAVGDVNGDGVDDIVAGGGPGAVAQVCLVNGNDGTSLGFFSPFAGFTGGVFVAAGDFNGDNKEDIVVGADAGGVPHVKVFDAVTHTEIASFFAYAPDFSGGVRVGVGDVNNDGTPDIITGAGAGSAGGHVKAFSGLTQDVLQSFFAFDPAFTGGIYVSSIARIPEPASGMLLLLLGGAAFARRRR